MPDVLLGGAGVGGGVGHHETGAAGGVERRGEELNPEVVGVVGAGKAVGEAATGADGVGEAFFVHRVDVEGRVGEDEVEAAGGGVRVVVVADGLLDVALQPVNREIHTAKVAGGAFLFLSVDGEFFGRVFPVL